MFNKKCPKCARIISRDFEFCPYCGYNIKREKNERNYGFLGKDDFLSPDIGMKMPFGFNKIFSSLISQLDKQFKDLDREIGKEIKPAKNPGIISKGFSINISTRTGEKPEIQIGGFGPGFENFKIQEAGKEKPMKIQKPEISDYQAKKLSKLPKEEAETKVRRLSNKVVYEILLPGVKNLKNIIISQLENSIEIKAFSEDKAYFKLLPINLPILNYKLDGETLILDLKPQKS